MLGAIEPAAAARHASKVARVARQLHARRGSGRPVSLKKRVASHQVPKPDDKKYRDDKIDISDLCEIIAIDPVTRTCTAEPGVTFRDLVAATLPHGLVPTVVPELSTITVGGAVSGCSLESMSFRHGGLHDACLAYEVVTGRGEVLHCTPDNEHALIFQMMHGSFGTLGVLSQLTFRLVPARPFVHVMYERHATLASYQDAIARHAADPGLDFMDGVLHSPTEHVLSLGRFVDEAPYTNRYDWLKVYHASTRRRAEDYLRTADYFFRYDNGVTNVFPRSALGRLLIGRFVHSHQVLTLAEKLHRLLPRQRPAVTVDLFVPFSGVPAFLDWYHRAIAHYPVWVVPYRRVRDYEWIADEFFAGVRDTLFVDFAVYGMPQPRGRNVYRELEEALVPVNGIKTLISYNFYDEDEFWTIWNRRNYLAVKGLTDPDNVFRDLYDKTCRAPRGLEPRARPPAAAPARRAA